MPMPISAVASPSDKDSKGKKHKKDKKRKEHKERKERRAEKKLKKAEASMQLTSHASGDSLAPAAKENGTGHGSMPERTSRQSSEAALV